MIAKMSHHAAVAAAALAGFGLGAWMLAGPPAWALEDTAQIISGGVGFGGGTVFVTPSGPATGLGESFAQAPFPAGKLSKLRVRLFTSQVPAGGSLSVMVRVNGADTNLTCSLTATGICTSGGRTKAIQNNSLVSLRVTGDLVDPGNVVVSYTLQLD